MYGFLSHEGDITCGLCGRQLSSLGKEIGLVVYNEDLRRWEARCATHHCSPVPVDVKVEDLQNYWLNLGRNGKGIVEELEEAGWEVIDYMKSTPVQDCAKCGGTGEINFPEGSDVIADCPECGGLGKKYI